MLGQLRLPRRRSRSRSSMALDAVGAWPPIAESHVEMDGAWALYEAWVRLQHGDVDTALVYAFGKSSLGDLRDVLTLQLDPYYVGAAVARHRAASPPSRRGPGSTPATARARAWPRSRRAAAATPRPTPCAQRHGDDSVDALLTEPYVVSPLRKHDCPPISDGAAAMVLAAGDRARERCASGPAWIRGIDHRIEAHALGVRDLTRSPSTDMAAAKAGVATARRRRRRAARAVRPPGADPARGARPERRRDASTRRAARWRANADDGRRASPASARRPAGSSTARPTAPSPTPPRARACSRTSSACWRAT